MAASLIIGGYMLAGFLAALYAARQGDSEEDCALFAAIWPIAVVAGCLWLFTRPFVYAARLARRLRG